MQSVGSGDGTVGRWSVDLQQRVRNPVRLILREHSNITGVPSRQERHLATPKCRERVKGTSACCRGCDRRASNRFVGVLPYQSRYGRAVECTTSASLHLPYRATLEVLTLWALSRAITAHFGRISTRSLGTNEPQMRGTLATTVLTEP